jgi:clan AA aspartic protease
MGEVTVKVKLWNVFDEQKAREGLISEDQIRRVEIDALIDTGATGVCLPKDIIEVLNLPQARRNVKVTYADNRKKERRRFNGLGIEIQGRDTLTFAVEEEIGTTPLIGQIVLEALDFIVDPVEQKIVPKHPESKLPVYRL